jgi:hypothetical protein
MSVCIDVLAAQSVVPVQLLCQVVKVFRDRLSRIHELLHDSPCTHQHTRLVVDLNVMLARVGFQTSSGDLHIKLAVGVQSGIVEVHNATTDKKHILSKHFILCKALFGRSHDMPTQQLNLFSTYICIPWVSDSSDKWALSRRRSVSSIVTQVHLLDHIALYTRK